MQAADERYWRRKGGLALRPGVRRTAKIEIEARTTSGTMIVPAGAVTADGTLNWAKAGLAAINVADRNIAAFIGFSSRSSVDDDPVGR